MLKVLKKEGIVSKNYLNNSVHIISLILISCLACNLQKNEKYQIINEASSIGLNIQEGGRIMTLGDKLNKSCAMLDFIKYFNKNETIIIGIGDNKNDIEMLDSSDFPCLVKNSKFNYKNLISQNYTLSSSEAPEGWKEGVKEVLIKLNFFGS